MHDQVEPLTQTLVAVDATFARWGRDRVVPFAVPVGDLAGPLAALAVAARTRTVFGGLRSWPCAVARSETALAGLLGGAVAGRGFPGAWAAAGVEASLGFGGPALHRALGAALDHQLAGRAAPLVLVDAADEALPGLLMSALAQSLPLLVVSLGAVEGLQPPAALTVLSSENEGAIGQALEAAGVVLLQLLPAPVAVDETSSGARAVRSLALLAEEGRLEQGQPAVTDGVLAETPAGLAAWAQAHAALDRWGHENQGGR